MDSELEDNLNSYSEVSTHREGSSDLESSENSASKQKKPLPPLDGIQAVCTWTLIDEVTETSDQHLGSSLTKVRALAKFIQEWFEPKKRQPDKISISWVSPGVCKMYFRITQRVQGVPRDPLNYILFQNKYKVTFDRTPQGSTGFETWLRSYPVENFTWVFDMGRKDFVEEKQLSVLSKFVQAKTRKERTEIYLASAKFPDLHNFPKKLAAADYIQEILNAKIWGGFQIPYYIFDHLKAAEKEYVFKKTQFENKVNILKLQGMMEMESDKNSQDSWVRCEICQHDISDESSCGCPELTDLRRDLEEVSVWKKSLEEFIKWFNTYCSQDSLVDRKKFIVFYSEEREMGKTTLAKLTAGVNPEYTAQRMRLIEQINEYKYNISHQESVMKLEEALRRLDLDVKGMMVPEWFTYLVNNINVNQLKNQETSKLLIFDDMKYPARDKIENWKSLLTSQAGVGRDAFVNEMIKPGMPVIVCTNDPRLLHLLTGTVWFKGQGTAIEFTRYIGPPGTQPQDVNKYKAETSFNRRTQKQMDQYENKNGKESQPSKRERRRSKMTKAERSPRLKDFEENRESRERERSPPYRKNFQFFPNENLHLQSKKEIPTFSKFGINFG